MQHALTTTDDTSQAGRRITRSAAAQPGSTRPLLLDRTARPPGRPAQHVDLELIFPVVNREDDVPVRLANAAAALLTLDLSVSIAIVDGGSSDRTLEAVDEVAAGSLLPIRVLGCSIPGWGAGALRGARTSRARWVGFGEPSPFGRGTVAALRRAAHLLAGGKHIVCLAAEGQRLTVMDQPVAELLFTDELPTGPGFVPALPDTARHAGLRMAAHGRIPAGDLDRIEQDSTLILPRITA
ncbi:glycosyltransferase family A protein [Actinoplanes sp. NPDC051859]|uniref:glycosyltransferase family A protein n=1 Tax=Actinoplanes sp. NPDC051859 TaxID=3363909 RepID=UPI0037A5811F